MATTIDVEDETILTSVFRDSFPESWRANPDFAMYLAELSSYGVEKLGKEPDRLADERAQVLQQTQELAFDNYKTFIQTADCSREIVEDFTVVEDHVAALLEKLPEFSDKCNTFMKEAQQISTSRRMNTLTLAKHTQLLEILEIPQLMDTCVRNSYYDEALELASYVRRLEKKHSSIQIIKDIVSEVHNSKQLMLNQLLAQLRSSIQLPACLRLIGYLRRMDLFSEAELRIKFLQARDAWFQGLLAGLPTEDAYQHITKVIETSRVHLFDIITQYRAIFSDDDPLLASNHDHSVNEAALFQGWVGQKVSQFLELLQTDLKHGIGNRLDSLLGQCMYFGLSFSRVGADFRGLLAPIFQDAALENFTSAVTEATDKFTNAMQSYTPVVSSSWLSSTTVMSSSGQGDQNLSPPLTLMDHAPLASYTNGILTAFNDLRLCAPLALVDDVTRALTESLLTVVETTVAYHRAEESTFSTREAEQFSGFCETIADQLVPYMGRCLQALFPQSLIAQTLGLTVPELQKWGTVGVLDVPSITAGLEPLLPVKEDPAPAEKRAPGTPDVSSEAPPDLSIGKSSPATKEGGPGLEGPKSGAPCPPPKKSSGRRVSFEMGDEGSGDEAASRTGKGLGGIVEEEEEESGALDEQTMLGGDPGLKGSGSISEGHLGGGRGGSDDTLGEGVGQGETGDSGIAEEETITTGFSDTGVGGTEGVAESPGGGDGVVGGEDGGGDEADAGGGWSESGWDDFPEGGNAEVTEPDVQSTPEGGGMEAVKGGKKD